MKKIFTLLFIILSTLTLFAQPTKILNIIATDLAYNDVDLMFYAVVSGSDHKYGNCLIKMDPTSGNVEKQVFIGSNPKRMKFTDDKKFVYISFHSIGVIKRVNLTTFKVDMEIILGPLGNSATAYALDFAIIGGTNNRVVVARSKQNTQGYFEDLVLYIDDEPQPETVTYYQNNTYCNITQLVSKSDGKTLFGYNSWSSGFECYRINVSDSGVNFNDKYTNLIENFVNIKIFDDRVISGNGRIINAYAKVPYIEGTLNIGYINKAYGFSSSPLHNAYIFPYTDYNTLYLNFFNQNTFSYFGSYKVILPEQLSSISYLVLSMEVIDEERIAVILTDQFYYQYLMLLDLNYTTFIENSDVKEISVYPNPATDYIQISAQTPIKEVSLFATDGRKVYSKQVNDLNEKISLEGLTKGIYLLRKEYFDKSVKTTRIIKN
jgi:hypothetical protein